MGRPDPRRSGLHGFRIMGHLSHPISLLQHRLSRAAWRDRRGLAQCLPRRRPSSPIGPTPVDSTAWSERMPMRWLPTRWSRVSPALMCRPLTNPCATTHSPCGVARSGMREYLALGYVPPKVAGDCISARLDYAYDDWCVAQAAKVLGKQDDYTALMQRSQNYRKQWDPHVGFMRSKNADGTWADPKFDEFAWGRRLLRRRPLAMQLGRPARCLGPGKPAGRQPRDGREARPAVCAAAHVSSGRIRPRNSRNAGNGGCAVWANARWEINPASTFPIFTRPSASPGRPSTGRAKRVRNCSTPGHRATRATRTTARPRAGICSARWASTR